MTRDHQEPGVAPELEFKIVFQALEEVTPEERRGEDLVPEEELNEIQRLSQIVAEMGSDQVVFTTT